MTFIEHKIRITCENIRSRIETRNESVQKLEMVRCGYKADNASPTSGYTPFEGGSPIRFKADEHAWLRFSVDIPETEGESSYLRFTTGREGEWDSLNPQGMVFVDGETTCTQALDVNHTEVLVPAGKHQITVYFYAGMIEGVLFPNVRVISKNDEVEKLYYDLSVAYNALQCLDRASPLYATVCNVLDRACMLVDLRDGRSPEFYASVKETLAFLQKEYFEALCGRDTDCEIALIGHTHIDVAWLWTLAQTAEKAQRSFSTVIQYMEKYPAYRFMSSQPQLYAYVKENDPELYEKIKARIREGRWTPEGAMWLESDTNLVSGESLVRQILYGKRFMKEEFGVDNHILWLPDVFGYSAALPQILKKCGIDTFFTSKISWNETDKFPRDNFVWEGLDGSTVFAAFSDNYVKTLNPGMIVDAVKKHIDKKYSTTHMSTFGFGDGGGGPTADMLENYERLQKGLPGLPRVTMRAPDDTLAEVCAQFEKNASELRFTPKWSGELYLEMHRGTYTSQAANKKNNRRSELLYQKAETAAATALMLTGAPYPTETIDKNWHTILKNQFHDIIPGSSIHEVYEVSGKEYAEVIAEGQAMVDTALDSICKKLSTEGGVFVYNPTPFEASGYVAYDGKAVYAESIPPHGYAVVPETSVCALRAFADEKHIENDYLRVTFDEKMNISSIYDKRYDRELIQPGESANVFEVFEDYPREYDAWEITEYYKQKKWIVDDVTAIEVVNTPTRAGIKIERKYSHSTLTQLVFLSPDKALVEFETEVDWHEDHVLLKTAFPLAIRASQATYEIQFGHLKRPTHRNTSWDQAMFEVSAHKWADLSEADYGAALLNDCKYGYSCEENVLTLSLLKAATYPDPQADRGHHSFTYALYPHAGTVEMSDTVKMAYLLNTPMSAREVGKQSGTLEARFTPIQSDTATAVIDTFKRAEDGNGYIVRLYDCAGRKAKVTLETGFAVESAYECDMLENNGESLMVEDGKVSFALGNFEVKTIRLIAK